MANVLEKIVLDKHQEIAQRKIDLPLESFIDGLTPSDRSFYAALAKPNAGFVLECKKASPSKGLIRENFDLDEIIQAYSPYAACISVLTDEKYFQGKFEYLEYIRSRVIQPVINKDFFVDSYQVHLARYHNADAVLLMLSVLTDAEYVELAELAHHYQLDVLTEVSNEQEVLRACLLKAKIIGINNRDLRDLSTDLATTERLVPMIKQHAQHQHVIISESGIYNHQEVRRLAPIVDGFLVGSSLMGERNIELAAKQLIYGKVKICGTTSLSGAKLVKDSPASYAGLIFAQKSKRFVTLEQAQQITYAVPFNYVGVFVDAHIDKVVKLAHRLGLVAVQLHGDENQAYIDTLRLQLNANIQIWLAKGVKNCLPNLNETKVDYFLLDCKVGEQSGGTGQAFSWQLLDEGAARSDASPSNIILAGGINPSNIKQAAALDIAMLDLNSGVESTPGIKDKDKINQAFCQLREY
jgi:indole-3-glycerol phosphate synthase/phosphoribosylanthranilate isomerase